ncbi:siderophore iron transporter [Fonsecaea pedrosoi]|nr:siderophore iron transporter [Fonsecaea pedrosoi]
MQTNNQAEEKTEDFQHASHVGHSDMQIEHLDADSDTDSMAEEAKGVEDSAVLGRHYFRHWRLVGSMAAMVLSYAAGFWAYVMPSFSLSVILADLESTDPSPNSIWIILSLTICQTVSFTIVGRLSDLFGRRWYQIIFGTIAFVGYIVASRAKTVNTLIGAGVLMGFGSATQTHCAAIGAELLPNKYRYLYFGAVAFLFGPLSAIAPGIALTLATHTSQGWRSIYYLLAGTTFAAVILFIICYHPPKFDQLHTRHTKWQFIKSLDYIGLILFCGGVVPFLFGISWGGQRYPWESYKVIVPIVVGGVVMIVFVLWGETETLRMTVQEGTDHLPEYFGKPALPLLPLRLFRSRNFNCLLACSCFGSMVFYALCILYPQQLGYVFGRSPSQAGWYSCTITAGVLAGQGMAGFTVKLFKYIKWQLLLSCIIFTAFVGASAAASLTLSMAAVFSILVGLGIGYMEIITISGAPLMVDTKDFGIAIGALFSIRTCFSTISDAVYVTILNTQITKNLPKYVIPAAMKAGLTQNAAIQLVQDIAAGDQAALATIPGITPQVIQSATDAAHTAFFKSFQMVYYSSIAFSFCAVIAALLVEDKLLEDAMTDRVARKLQGIKTEQREIKVVAA